MKTQIVAGLVAVLVLGGCESNYNPGNWGWFSRSQSTPTLEPGKGYEDKTDYRPMVEQVTSMSVDRVHGGAIINAVGLPKTQGYWAADLVPTYETESGKPTSKDGVMRLEFRVVPPRTPQPSVNQRSREVVAGLFLSDQALQGARQIIVVGEQNQRSSSR